MSTKQSAYFKGNARTPVPHPHRKGEVIEYLFTHTFTETVASTDVLELFPIFPYGRIVGFDFETENVGAINVDIGLMSGTPGDATSVRTCGAELANDVAANGAVAVKLTSLALLAALPANGETAVSIGLVPANDITAAANKKLHCRIRIAS